MLGGGHVRRPSVGSIIVASPCVRVEERKRSGIQHVDRYESLHKGRIVERPSIASTSSFQFRGEHMSSPTWSIGTTELGGELPDGEDMSN